MIAFSTKLNVLSECCIGVRVTPKVNIVQCFSGKRGGDQKDDGQNLKKENIRLR